MDTATPAHSIHPAQLACLIGRADAPLLLDVRRTAAFEASPWLLAGASHCPPEDVARLLAALPPRPAVVYCAHGHEVSREAAATLRDGGWDVRWLAGGIDGGETGVDDPRHIAQWRASAPPRLRKRPDLGVTGHGSSRWITRARPKIDRIACPWLIRRFIDPRAQFFYVPEAQVFDEAQRLGAVPFDIDGAPISHEGERCSFDALLQQFGLQLPALHTLADIVRGADTARLDLAPQAAGLLAFSLGLSRLHCEDQEMLAAALPLYDALFAWCRAGQADTHSWRVHQPAGAAA